MKGKPGFNQRVGEIRPSQLMFTYGVGAVIDLPKLSVLVAGLEDWSDAPQHAQPISEERLLGAVRQALPSVSRLLGAPAAGDSGPKFEPFGGDAGVGVGVIPFPRWLLCPLCRSLAPLESGLFELRHNPYHPDRSAYRHVNCGKTKSPPEVVPARFVVACEDGHLDDFPWIAFVHRGPGCAEPKLSLRETGPGGEVSAMVVRCSTCEQERSLAQAFGQEQREKLPLCRGRRPHLRDYDPEGCRRHVRPLILGASNLWFPSVISLLAIPGAGDARDQWVADHWAILNAVKELSGIALLRLVGKLGPLAELEDEAIWAAIERHRARLAEGVDVDAATADLKTPEWRMLIAPEQAPSGNDFRLRAASVPTGYGGQLRQVVLAERLREVRALVGFTRLDALDELADEAGQVGVRAVRTAPLSRHAPRWVPANEVRGEGIFIQLSEAAVLEWEQRPAVRAREAQFQEAHAAWRAARGIVPSEAGFPGIRYVLVHTLAHLLMRQLALESGYAAPSIRERIYARPAGDDEGPMAGLLIYTAAPDSEGTLGGLVALGKPEALERHLDGCLEAARLCASDPLCAERPPDQSGQTLHAASCHACGFAPETSCERGNKYLDRSLVVPTIERDDLAFFT